ncbi:MAG TPA: 1-deoxy-D-xylulose-5-phosphate synthase [Clostridia bacterium]|nr:1-deoxy-D-xylulose-5-phosphate synthase [Clostridia bacterium]
MSSKRILDLSGNPQGLRQLSAFQLKLLAEEIRAELVNTVSCTGGHLASNLGVVELTLALMYCFDVVNDKIVWDVGHQCYTYKLLTGRLDRFSTLRQENGISGFPKTEESAYDSFISGHASTSIAVAYGLKRSMTLQGKSSHVVAVIGDGSLTGGMAYEGLNNVGKSKENLIIIINDNEMAISKNEGAVAKYLSVIRSKPGYFKAKKVTEQALLSVPVAGEALRDLVAGSKTVLKQVIYPSTFFEELGFTYFGPVDGHNLKNLCDILAEAKKNDGPSIIHVQTKKGKGYAFAEQNPGAYHGVSRFDVKTGQPLSASGESFSSVFGKELVRLAEEDVRICAITAAMEHGTGLQYFGRRFKNVGRYYDVGIAEEFGVTFASALGAGGMLPVFAIYSTFLQRGYDQLIHDAAIEKRHVVLGVDRAGIVGDDGETHQGIFDVAFLSTIPGVTVLAPANYAELKSMLKSALKDYDGPVALRYPRGSESPALAECPATGKAFDEYSTGSSKRVIVTYGRTFAAAKEAAKQVGNTAIIKLNRVLPLHEGAVAAAAKYDQVLFAEEGIRSGGVGMQFIAALALNGYRGKTVLHAIDGFVPQSSVERALHTLRLDTDGLATLLQQMDK